ncbi:achaete-scute homolog 1-like [Paramuricea clavata]|uniref:Achaete-scute homolog 1-like n=1 Tax=Paramuricea clavata TaxID=317549 RepID=A0A6S7FEB8_PARCT|nr:achaete-scute homolog 1-like [Paramuricea clavata]
MPESNFDIDRLGMLTLQHFEYGVESDRSSGGENCYSNSEHGSNTSSPTYLTDDSESPLSSPTELKHSVKFWEQNEDTAAGISSEDVDDEVSQHEASTCRYKRGRRGKETISRRNERERRRVRQISEGFCELRKRLMIQPRNRKLPKLQILRKAILYIKNLQDMIRESDLQNASARNRLAACPTTPSEMPPMAYLYDPSYMNKQPQGMQTPYVNTPTVQRPDFRHQDPQSWYLQRYQL